MEKINRRSALLAAGAALAGVVAGTASESEAANGLLGRRRNYAKPNEQAGQKVQPAPQPSKSPTPAGLRFNNEDFYTDGKFNVDKAKDAIIELCRYFKYPIFSDLKDLLWVSDYGTGRFTELGLACIGIINHDKDKLGQTFMMQDLFLLPGQMLPEHWHIKGDGIAVKNEGWFIRWGKSFIVGIGSPNLPPEIKIPECHMGGKVEVKHGKWVNAGEYAQLAKLESKHWQMAGPEGCILTEVANLHTNSAVRHNDPAINDHFLNN